MKKFNKEFLFSILTYVHESKIKRTKTLYSNHDISTYFNSHIQEFFEGIANRKYISLTDIILKNYDNSIILSKNSDDLDDFHKRILTFSLNNIDDSEVKKFINKVNYPLNNTSIINLKKTFEFFNDLISGFSQKFNCTSYYIYALRPYIKDGYQTALFFHTLKPLKDDELLDIINILTIVFDKTIFYLLKKAQIKANIAAIMSRNLSHNIGSHVLSYLKSYLNNIPDTLAKRLLLEVQKIEGESQNEHEFVLKLTENWNKKIEIQQVELEDYMEAPFILGLSRFINYLQERQDFIATISTDYIPYYSTISFKDFIYDELNYDYKIQRHKEKNKYKVENILLDHIALSENYHRNNIQIYFRNFDGLDPKHPNLAELRKFSLDLPGGIIGRQAIFSIVENILRNAAKHGKLTDNHQLKLTFDIQHPSKLEEGKYKVIENSEYWEFSITDNNHNGTRALPQILKGLAEPYTDPTTGKLMESNKGIKEMRISAAWLRNENVAEINELKPIKNNKETFPILSVQLTCTDTNEIVFDSRDFNFEKHDVNKLTSKQIYELCGINTQKETNLRFTLYLRKAQKMALITEREFEVTTEEGLKLDIYKNNEWQKFTLEQYRSEKNKNFQVILVDKELNERREEIKRMASTRCIFDIDFVRLRETVLKKYHEDKENYRNLVFETYLWKWIKDSSKEFDKINVLPKIAIIEPEIKRIKGKDSDTTRGYKKSDKVEIYGDEKAIIDELIIYRNHNDSETDFEEFKQVSDNKYKHFRFIEGISGNNSTDRLVRNDDLSNYWYLKMVESGLTSVLVFDERIFARLNKSVLESDFDKREKWHQPITEYTREMMHRKNIHVFNIIKHNQHFLIIDIGNQVVGEIYFEHNQLRFKLEEYINHENNKDLYPSNDNRKEIKPHDFVLIHQGLLDKINDQYWNDEVEEYYQEEIKELKQDNLEYFESPRKQYENSNYKKFNIIFKENFKQLVHSGRSKLENLPKDAVFVQYSSVEYALFDCKYSLTELLYSARIED